MEIIYPQEYEVECLTHSCDDIKRAVLETHSAYLVALQETRQGRHRAFLIITTIQGNTIKIGFSF